MMINKDTENKRRGFLVEDGVTHNSAISDADVVPLLGSIPQGTTSLTRLGDRVKPKSLTVRGIIGLNPEYNPDNLPLLVSVYILQCKDKKTNTLVAAGAGMAYLLRPNIGGTEQVPFNGNTIESTYPVNDDKFKVLFQKKYRLAPGTIAMGPREFDHIRFSKTIKSSQMPASLTWDEGTGDDCNNFAPFLVIGYSYVDGRAPDTVGRRLITHISSEFNFEDA